MKYVDFHTHLDWYEENALFSQLKDFDGTIIAASVDKDSFGKNIRILEKANALGYTTVTGGKLNLIPTVGIHPQNADKAPEDLSLYDELCNQSLLIGEIGMDFCWCKEVSSINQERVFRYFLEHCNQTEKYCVIHTKDAESQICKILEEYPNIKPIIHWYDGPKDVYQEFIKRGYFQTFGCETIRSKHIQDLLKITPKELILAETDNPTGEPWLGGTDDSIFLIKRIYKDIGNVIGVEEEICRNFINKNSLGILNILY